MSSEIAQPFALQFAEQRDDSNGFRVFIFLVAHVVLGLLMAKVSAVATVHVLATVVVGIYWAIFDDRVERVAYVGAYIIGAEVLWRMTGALMFWETGKYAIVAIFAISICRSGRFRGPLLPVTYLALLIPSTIMVLLALGWDEVREGLSFNLSGPLALTASAWFFYQVKISRKQLQQILVILTAPILGIAAIALYGIMTDPYAFYGSSTGSDFGASGGFGPNQVSSILGLGGMLLLFFILDQAASWNRRLLFLAGVLWLASQCALTFSRGGLYNLIVGVAVAFPFLLKDPATRVKLIITVISLLIVTNFVLLPALESLTYGKLSTRFESVDTTGRSDLFLADLELWQEHPILGVGPGQAAFFRDVVIGRMAAHTEFTRLLAEHGTLGFAALLVLLVAGLHRIVTAPSNLGKAVTAALIGWSLFYMMYAGMRLAAPSFLFGLTYATLGLSEENFAMGFMVAKRETGEMTTLIEIERASEQLND